MLIIWIPFLRDGCVAWLSTLVMSMQFVTADTYRPAVLMSDTPPVTCLPITQPALCLLSCRVMNSEA